MRIGVLALQGDFIEHITILEKLGAEVIAIRRSNQLEGVDGLILPGGESTTIITLMHGYGLFQSVKELAQSGLPVIGTCAGMILLAKKVTNADMDTLAVMDIEVRRNAFGRQVDSFETELDIPMLGEKRFSAVFIRAPFIEHTASSVEVICRLPDDTIVAARQGNLLALSFHPELSGDNLLHRYFLKTVMSYVSGCKNESRNITTQAC